MLTIRTLSGVAIELDGHRLTGLASRKAAALLIYLACQPGPVSRDAAATLLWGESPPARALANLSVALSSLRKQVDAYIVTSRHAIAFNHEAPYELDLAAFDAALNEARALQQARGCLTRVAAARLNAATELVSSDFLLGFHIRHAPDFESWALLEQERVRQAHYGALYDLAAFYAERGAHDRSIGVAQRLVAADPLDEFAQRLLIEQLWRDGQQAAAVAQCAACRAVMAHELDLPVEPETESLCRTVLAEQPPAKAVRRPAGTLRQQSRFFGRTADLAAIRAHLDAAGVSLVTLVGPGGVGKSRLAAEAAIAALPEFLDGVFLAPLAAVTDLAGFVTAVADAVGYTFSGPAEPAMQLRRYVRDKEALLVLDNFEQLIEPACLEFVTSIVRDSAELRLLVTSRERLGLPFETVLPVRGLPLTATTPNRLSPAAELFAAIARQLRRDVELDSEQLDQLCALVDGLPLALELAASWIRVLPLDEIVAEVTRGIDLLATTLRDVPARHRSMRAVFERSWQLLAADEQAVYATLSLFRGGFTQDAAHAVAGATAPLLTTLVDKSLLRQDEDGRYSVHPLLEQFSAEKRRAMSVNDAAQQHAAHFAAWMQPMLSAIRRADLAAVGQIRAEAENLRAAWDWSVAQGHVPFFAAIWQSYYAYLLDVECQYAAGEARFTQAIAAIERRPDAEAHRALVAKLWLCVGWYNMELHAPADAGSALNHALRIGRALSLPLVEAEAMAKLAMVSAWEGKLDRALEMATAAVDLCRAQPGADRTLALTLHYLGLIQQYRGEYEASLLTCQECAELDLAAESWADYDVTLVNVASAQYYLGRTEAAYQTFRECLAVERKLGNRARVATSLHNLMEVSWKLGKFEEARQYGREALDLFRDTGQTEYAALSIAMMATIAVDEGPLDAAMALQRQALAEAQEIETTWVQLQVLLSAGNLLKQLGGALATPVLTFVSQHEQAFAEHRDRAQELLAGLDEGSDGRNGVSAEWTIDSLIELLLTRL